MIPALLSLVLVRPASGQLRPLEPLDWGGSSDQGLSTVELGSSALFGQRASLAGTEGTLLDLGTFQAAWSFGRASVHLSGTVLRVFEDTRTLEAPVEGTREMNDEARIDVGDQRISTVIRWTADAARRFDGALRFGVRLPTTDNRIGLERDETDFFATVAGRYRLDGWSASGELGMAVVGTRDPANEQVDPVVYALGLQREGGWLRPGVVAVGQIDTRPTRDKRGNEDLGEIRLGLTVGENRWAHVGVVRGFRPFSPSFGVSLEVGVVR